jgi:TP901 family phage tail tape measure protein
MANAFTFNVGFKADTKSLTESLKVFSGDLKNNPLNLGGVKALSGVDTSAAQKALDAFNTSVKAEGGVLTGVTTKLQLMETATGQLKVEIVGLSGSFKGATGEVGTFSKNIDNTLTGITKNITQFDAMGKKAADWANRAQSMGETEKKAIQGSATALMNEINLYKQLAETGQTAAAQKLIPSIQKLNGEFEATTSVTKRAATAMQSWAANIQRAFMQTISYSLSLGVVREAQKLLNDAIQYTIELNKEMVKIQVLQVAGAQTPEQIYSLAQSFNVLAQQMGVTTLEVAQGSVEWLRQGRTIAETQKLLQASLMLSKLGALSSADATNYLTSTINSYAMSVDEAAVVVDKLVAVDNQSATSAGELATALRYSAAAASEVGVSFDKLVSYIGTVSSVTRQNAEMVGQAMKTILTRMQDIRQGGLDGATGINNVEIALSRVNIKLRDSDVSFRDFSAVLEELAGKWNTLNEVEQANIGKAIAGVRQRNMFNVLMQNMNMALKLQGIEANSAGLAMDRYSIYLRNVEASQNRLKASFQGLVQSGKDFNGLIITLNNTLASIVNWITKIGGLKAVIIALGVAITILYREQVGKLIISFVGMVTAALADAAGLSVLDAALWITAGAIDTVTASVLAFLTSAGGIGLVLSLAIGALALFIINTKSAKEELVDIQGEIKDTKTVLDDLYANKKSIYNLSEEFKTLSANTKKTADETQRLTDVQNQLKSILPGLIGYYDTYGNFIITSTDSIKAQTQAILEEIDAKKALLDLQNKEAYNLEAQALNEAKYTLNKPGGKSGGTGWVSKNKLTPMEEAEYREAIAKAKVDFSNMGMEAQKAFMAKLVDPDLKKEFSDFYKSMWDEATKTNTENLYNLYAKAREAEFGAQPVIKPTLDPSGFAVGMAKLQAAWKDFRDLQDKISKGTITSKEIEDWEVLGVRIDNVNGKWEIGNESASSYSETLMNMIFGANDLTDAQMRAANAVINLNNSVASAIPTFDELNSEFDAINNAAIEQAKNNSITADTVNNLISKYPQLAQYITMVGDAFIFDTQSAKTHLIELINHQLALYNLVGALKVAANGLYVFAEIEAVGSRMTHAQVLQIQALVAQLNSLGKASASGGGGGGGADAARKKIQDEYDLKIKDAENEKKALKDKLEGFKKIIDARKAILKAMKDESDYQDTLRDKQKSVSKIQAELLAISLDNSEEAQAKRLQLQENLDKAQADLEKTQADRSYNLQVEALDKEYRIYEDMINAQIDLIDKFIEKLREALKEILDKMGNKGGVGGSVGGGTTQKTQRTPMSISAWRTDPTDKTYEISDTAWSDGTITVSRRKKATPMRPIATPVAEGGLITGGIPNQDSVNTMLMPGEFVLRKNIVDSIGLSALNNLNKSGSMGNASVSMPITVMGNLDKNVIPDIERIADKLMEKMNDTFRKRGVTRATNQYVN